MKMIIKRLMAIILIVTLTTAFFPVSAIAEENSGDFRLKYWEGGEEITAAPGTALSHSFSINRPATWAGCEFSVVSAIGISSVSLSGTNADKFNTDVFDEEGYIDRVNDDGVLWVPFGTYSDDDSFFAGKASDAGVYSAILKIDLDNGTQVSYPLTFTLNTLPTVKFVSTVDKYGVSVQELEVGPDGNPEEAQTLDIARTPITVKFAIDQDRADMVQNGGTHKILFTPSTNQPPEASGVSAKAISLSPGNLSIQVSFSRTGHNLYAFGFDLDKVDGSKNGLMGWMVDFVIGSSSTGSGEEPPSSGNNTANNGNAADQIKITADILLKTPVIDLPKSNELPAGVKAVTTAGGGTVIAIPVALTTGSASVGLDLFSTLSSAPKGVGLNFQVKAGLNGGSMEVVIPGGFNNITEPGRFGYSMDYADKAENNDDMLKAVKGEGAVSTTAKIGGNQTLPVVATITVDTKMSDGTSVNIYKYDPNTKTFTLLGKAVAKGGKLTFGTKIMGEMIFTTGTI